MGFLVQLTALIEGRTTGSRWEFADGANATNQPFVAHAWTTPGDYAVVLRAFNESQPAGVSATVVVHVGLQPIHYVAANSLSPVAPYNSWATAATNIQDAVDAVTVPNALVLVTNGTYAFGGRAISGTMTNRVAVDKLLILRSVNGPQLTVIQGLQVPGTVTGEGAIRCVYLSNGASLSGFTLTSGGTVYGADGGGVRCDSPNEMVTNCILRGNVAGYGGGASGGTLNNCTFTGNSSSSGYEGGGAYYSTLNNCTLSGNSATYGPGGGAFGGTLNNCVLTGNSCSYDGGGAAGSTLNNCTLTGNSADSIFGGGGAAYSVLNNCIVYSNAASQGTNLNYESGTLNYCCTTPLATNGVGNITNAPLFVNQAAGNLRLQSNSPCINAGFNASAPYGLDLDSNPRIAGGTVDIGAYEFQSPTSIISYAWLQQYNLPTDGSADAADPDHDGLSNWQEWRCGTDPTSALSALLLLPPAATSTGVTLSWPSVPGVNYFLERSSSLEGVPPFVTLGTNLSSQSGITTYTDTNAIGMGPWFYRLGVGN